MTVEVDSGDTCGIDSNGDIFVSGSTICINSEQVSEIPAEQMGGGGMQR